MSYTPDFESCVAIVTGASTGLGRAIAVELAGRGARAVVINFIGQPADGEETAEAVRALGAEPILAVADVGDDLACREIVNSAARFGRVDCLFNNAATTTFALNHGNLDAVSAADFARIYRVNVIGPFQMVRAARTLLEASPRGAVTNTSSCAGFSGIGTSIPYTVSKGALNNLTLALARALAPRIRVNAVCPGFMDTTWFKGMSDEGRVALRDQVAAMVPLHVASKPEDIAGAAVFLASPAARHITGELLKVDAGASLALGMWSTTVDRH